MEERGSYPISDEKRQQLRSSGIVPFSRNFVSSAIMFGLIGSLSILLYYSSAELQALFTTSLEREHGLDGTSFSKEVIGLSFHFFSTLVLKLLLVIVFFVLLGGLIQTSFLFNLNLIFAPYDRRRPLARQAALSMRVQSFLFGIVKYLLFCLLLFFIAASLFDSLLISSLPGTYLNLSMEKGIISAIKLLIPKVTAYFYWILISAVCYTLVIGLISLIVVRIRFEKMNQMTRFEVDSELKEQGAGIRGTTESLEDNG